MCYVIQVMSHRRQHTLTNADPKSIWSSFNSVHIQVIITGIYKQFRNHNIEIIIIALGENANKKGSNAGAHNLEISLVLLQMR